jgi:hypothetical protein
MCEHIKINLKNYEENLDKILQMLAVPILTFLYENGTLTSKDRRLESTETVNNTENGKHSRLETSLEPNSI